MSKIKKNNVELFYFYYASGALECPLPRSPNTTTAIAINTPTAAPNALIAASAISEMQCVKNI